MDSEDDYEYSDQEDEYSVEQDDDDEMEWSNEENPNAAPTQSFKPSE